MKRIHFENMTNRYWLGILIISLVFIFVGTFEYIAFANQAIYQYMRAAGFILAALYFSKGFWFKNYVRWNHKNILIRLNSWSSKSVKYKEIKSTEIIDKVLLIQKLDEEILSFDLKNFKDSDLQRLHQILAKFAIT